ncbi:MAG: hypothetical protein U9Q17_04280 [Chloroflexota bacterium]|nr:hypothetical protein [Chloroflexota bacterium]
MSGERVPVDTSIWIEYFGNPSRELASRVESYLSEEAASMPAVVPSELIQGAKSEREPSAIEELAQTAQLLKEQENTWRQAGQSHCIYVRIAA